MMITFKLKPHSLKPDANMVEVWSGETFLAGIYPGDPDDGPGVKIVSKYLNGFIDDQRHPLPPAIAVLFDLERA
jgi:hypothetical protein